MAVRVVDGVPRVFAEYLDGGSLAEWIGDGRLYAGDARQGLARLARTPFVWLALLFVGARDVGQARLPLSSVDL